jgi:SWI/SNF-related matrix-associated actin-dependent regulator of chromatin subfamily A-like protein 1
MLSHQMSLAPPPTRVSTKLAWVEDDEIKVKFKYDYSSAHVGTFDDFVNDSRAVTGRRWDSVNVLNRFPLDSAPEVRALAEKWGIGIAEEVRLLPGYDALVVQKKAREHNVTSDGKHLFVAWDYNPNLIAAIHHHVPNAEWKNKKGAYEVPLYDLIEVIKFAQAYSLTVDPALILEGEQRLTVASELFEASSLLDWPEFDIPGLVKPLRPYQRAGVAYMLRVRRCILADQQGLGKTVQAISTVVLDESLPVLIVCKNRLKETIREDLLEFYPALNITVLNGGSHQEVPRSDVVIVNYDIVSQRYDDIIEHGFKSLIVDESHYIKNGKRKSSCPVCGEALRIDGVNCSHCGAKKIKVRNSWSVRRTNAVMNLAHSLPPEALVLLLTGTPINIRPGELIRQLECIDRLDIFGGEWKFRMRYCPDNKTARNLKELNTKLRENCFIRRKTKDVYPQLPKVQHSVQRIVLSKEKMERYHEIENDVVEYLAIKARERARDEGLNPDRAYWNKRRSAERAEALIRVNVLRGAIVELKFEEMVEWVANFLEDGDQKIILFAERIKIVEGFYEKYKDIAVKVRGDVSNKTALAATHSFQEDDWCRVFVANLQSAKEGYTLTASSDVIFCEPEWAPTSHAQGISRSYGRTNDPHGTTAWWLLAPETIDVDMFRMLQDRQAVVDAVTDGEELDEEQVSIVDEMIRLLEARGEERLRENE